MDAQLKLLFPKLDDFMVKLLINEYMPENKSVTIVEEPLNDVSTTTHDDGQQCPLPQIELHDCPE